MNALNEIPDEGTMETVKDAETAQLHDSADAKNDDTIVPVRDHHINMAERLPLTSWGSESAPSIPSVDEEGPVRDKDSAVDSIKSSTISLRSSIYEFVEENGRTYHRYKEGKYALPNDEQEQERLDLQHALFLVTTQGRLFLAPIGDDPHHVLDIATGTGLWAIEFAQMYPSAQVVGTDLSPIQPEYVPSNCSFEIDDAEDEWTFSQKFDFIHGRALLSCFNDPLAMIKQAYDALAPGGYLELQDGIFPMEYIGEPPVNCALYRWNKIILGGAEKAGRSWTNVKNYKRYLIEAGFEDVQEKRFFWPMSPWAKGKYFKTVARFFQEDMLNGVEGISLRVLGALGWPREDINIFLEQVKQDMRDTNIHAYLNIVFVIGRKPEAPKTA